jgi:hypothetical protein
MDPTRKRLGVSPYRDFYSHVVSGNSQAKFSGAGENFALAFCRVVGGKSENSRGQDKAGIISKVS